MDCLVFFLNIQQILLNCMAGIQKILILVWGHFHQGEGFKSSGLVVVSLPAVVVLHLVRHFPGLKTF